VNFTKVEKFGTDTMFGRAAQPADIAPAYVFWRATSATRPTLSSSWGSIPYLTLPVKILIQLTWKVAYTRLHDVKWKPERQLVRSMPVFYPAARPSQQ